MTEHAARTSSRRALALVLALIVAGAAGCNAVTDFSKYTFVDQDAGPGGSLAPVDVTTDGGVDAGLTTATTATTFVQTSGGAVIVTSDYRLSISVGSPQPMGDLENASHHLTIGPDSAQ